ncbi:hypothetical protein ACAF76_002460 [Brevibacillus sp. TJ4]|uniref:hypothetical protein n=1 Tax=Brevibacillus sp. TJ4 TaxID=3234853 RepID=UPI0037D66030
MSSHATMNTDLLREMVCENCPATGWGKRTRCQVHDQHVGNIQACPEWDKYVREQQEKEKQAKGGRTDIREREQEPALSLMQRTEDDIRDYPYMQIEVMRIQRYLQESGQAMVASYGLEAALPKGQGRHGDSTYVEALRRERKWKRLQSLQHKIERIDRALEQIGDEQERLVLEALLDGDKNNLIAREIGVSRQRYYEIKRRAVMKLAEAMERQEGDLY